MHPRRRRTLRCCQLMTTWQTGLKACGVVAELHVMIWVPFDRCAVAELAVGVDCCGKKSAIQLALSQRFHLRGFRVLRVYGNDPRLSHVNFLTRCKALGLKVVVATWMHLWTADESCHNSYTCQLTISHMTYIQHIDSVLACYKPASFWWFVSFVKPGGPATCYCLEL